MEITEQLAELSEARKTATGAVYIALGEQIKALEKKAKKEKSLKVKTADGVLVGAGDLVYSVSHAHVNHGYGGTFQVGSISRTQVGSVELRALGGRITLTDSTYAIVADNFFATFNAAFAHYAKTFEETFASLEKVYLSAKESLELTRQGQFVNIGDKTPGHLHRKAVMVQGRMDGTNGEPPFEVKPALEEATA